MPKSISDIILKLFGRRAAYTYRYFAVRKCLPNFSHPQNLSEIIISRILSNESVKFADYADKIKVRDYVRSKGLNSILLTHYHYWDKAEGIDVSELPDKFVLKTNNGEGGHDIVICRDKSTFDLDAAKEKLGKALTKKGTYDLQYNFIKPRILCEELIDMGDGSQPTDYKFLCIHGEPVSIFVASDRNENGKARFCSKTIDWQPLDDIRVKFNPSHDVARPKHLEEMVRIARVLSADFELVRVDLYEYKDQVYFGELTFSPGGGLFSYNIEALEKYGRIFNEGKKR